jgi:FdrA protein
MMTSESDNPAGEKSRLLEAPPRVVNIGLERFAEDLAAQGVAVQHVQWAPPAGGNVLLADLLSRLDGQ